MIFLLYFLLFSVMGYTSEVKILAIGDSPYSVLEKQYIHNTLKEKIKKSKIPFLVIYGDIKSSKESCTNNLLQQRYQLFKNLHKYFFYTPGDNEWTDCDREGLEYRFSELERLEYLKKIFFKYEAWQNSFHYTTQSNFIENGMWDYENVQFATIHLVGTNNGRQEILKDDKELALSMVETRDNANRVWINKIFQNAQKKHFKAVVIFTQADVTSMKNYEECSSVNQQNCNGFANFNQALKQASQNMDIPILLVHGDTHPYCMDKNFGGKDATKLWRLNAWGDFQTPADATVISIQEQKSEPFKAITLMGNNVALECKE